VEYSFTPQKGVHALLYEVNVAVGDEGDLCIVPSVINTGDTGIKSIRYHMRFLNVDRKPIGSITGANFDYTYSDQECDLAPGEWINDIDGTWTGWHYNLYDGVCYVQVWVDSVTTSGGKKRTLDGVKLSTMMQYLD